MIDFFYEWDRIWTNILINNKLIIGLGAGLRRHIQYAHSFPSFQDALINAELSIVFIKTRTPFYCCVLHSASFFIFVLQGPECQNLSLVMTLSAQTVQKMNIRTRSRVRTSVNFRNSVTQVRPRSNTLAVFNEKLVIDVSQLWTCILPFDLDSNFEVPDHRSKTEKVDCKCKQGFHCSGLNCMTCLEHASCGPGYGVQTKGTIHLFITFICAVWWIPLYFDNYIWLSGDNHHDTVCHICPEGTFSNVSSMDADCQKWTK